MEVMELGLVVVENELVVMVMELGLVVVEI